MNKLFTFAGAADIRGTSNHRKLLEFYELDKQIAERYETSDNISRDFTLAVLKARAKNILKDLKIL